MHILSQLNSRHMEFFFSSFSLSASFSFANQPNALFFLIYLLIYYFYLAGSLMHQLSHLLYTLSFSHHTTFQPLCAVPRCRNTVTEISNSRPHILTWTSGPLLYSLTCFFFFLLLASIPLHLVAPRSHPADIPLFYFRLLHCVTLCWVQHVGLIM